MFKVCAAFSVFAGCYLILQGRARKWILKTGRGTPTVVWFAMATCVGPFLAQRDHNLLSGAVMTLLVISVSATEMNFRRKNS